MALDPITATIEGVTAIISQTGQVITGHQKKKEDQQNAKTQMVSGITQVIAEKQKRAAALEESQAKERRQLLWMIVFLATIMVIAVIAVKTTRYEHSVVGK